MSSVAERLLESWLDSQGERRYQAAFIQMLVSTGWQVLHNTRHSPIEFGKDVIARDPQGVLYCIQLKGNPGSRLTKTQAAELLTQFNELLLTHPSREFQNADDETHVALFVTNGEIDEEARALFNAAGRVAGRPGVPASSYELWSRGNLLHGFGQADVWPASAEGIRLVLNLLAGDGRASADAQEVGAILSSMMPPPDAGGPARKSALTSMLLLAEIIKGRWYETRNHHALFAVTVLAAVAGLALCDTAERLAIVRAYVPIALEHCADLLEEASDVGYDPDRVWAERDPLAEFDIQWERRRLLADCESALLLSGSAVGAPHRSQAGRLVRSFASDPMPWGQATIPSVIVAFLARSTVDPGLAAELDLARMLGALLRKNAPDAAGYGLPQPYYGFADVWALITDQPGATTSRIFEDSSAGRVFLARALMLMLARRNLKRTCGQLWPNFTQVIHEEPELPEHVFFSAVLTREGTINAVQRAATQIWHDLVNEAVEAGEAHFLEPFGGMEWLLAAYLCLVPYRAWTRVVMWLDDRLGSHWYDRTRRVSY